MLQFDRTRLFPAVSLYLTFQSGINRLISTLGQKEIYMTNGKCLGTCLCFEDKDSQVKSSVRNALGADA